MKYEDKKSALTELQDLLNNMVISDSLLSPEILDVSVKLDVLINEFYFEKLKNKEKVFQKL